MADADLVNIAAEDGIHPDAGVLAHDHVTDELRGVVDVACFWELRSGTLIGADHVFIV
jgi:hypothetical protein